MYIKNDFSFSGEPIINSTTKTQNDTLPIVNFNLDLNQVSYSSDNELSKTGSVSVEEVVPIEVETLSYYYDNFNGGLSELVELDFFENSAYLDDETLSKILDFNSNYHNYYGDEYKQPDIDCTIEFDRSTHKIIKISKNDNVIFEYNSEDMTYSALVGNGWNLIVNSSGNVVGSTNSKVASVIKDYDDVHFKIDDEGNVSLYRKTTSTVGLYEKIAVLTCDGNVYNDSVFYYNGNGYLSACDLSIVVSDNISASSDSGATYITRLNDYSGKTILNYSGDGDYSAIIGTGWSVVVDLSGKLKSINGVSINEIVSGYYGDNVSTDRKYYLVDERDNNNSLTGNIYVYDDSDNVVLVLQNNGNLVMQKS